MLSNLRISPRDILVKSFPHQQAIKPPRRPPARWIGFGAVYLSRIVRTGLESLFESANSFGQALSELRQFLTAKQKQCDCQNHQQVPRL